MTNPSLEVLCKRVLTKHQCKSVELVFDLMEPNWVARAMPHSHHAHTKVNYILRERGQTGVTLDEMSALLDEINNTPIAKGSGKTALDAVKMLHENLGG